MKPIKRVLVAMSGGVDSSMAAYLLKKKGYDVAGATMRLWDEIDCDSLESQSCCNRQGIEDARAVAAKLGISHFVLDLSQPFRDMVIDYFKAEYLKGRTPNPCIVCNQRIKFGIFLQRAQAMGFDAIATGHHARIEKSGDDFNLCVAADTRKDQSYFLFVLKQDIMDRVLFPCGQFKKEELRTQARDIGLPVSEKLESQEICFVPDNDYAMFLKKRFGINDKKGLIKNRSGETLGEHNGYFHYTVGQRRGIGVAHASPLYVLETDSDHNEVIVGEKTQVLSRGFGVSQLIWISKRNTNTPITVSIKIRSNHKAARARMIPNGSDSAQVEFDEPQEAVTPGQAAVFYDEDRVLGGGWIN